MVQGSKVMNSQKSRIHQVFGFSCLVFGMKYMPLYRHVRILNTKHQILNTLVISMFSDFLRDCRKLRVKVLNAFQYIYHGKHLPAGFLVDFALQIIQCFQGSLGIDIPAINIMGEFKPNSFIIGNEAVGVPPVSG